MRLIKTFGVGAIAAVAAVTIAGATSASAANTQLCNSHTALTCDSAATSVSMNNSGLGAFFIVSSDYISLCLTVSWLETPLALANPQQVHTASISFTSCGTTSAHNNCTWAMLELPLANLNKIGLDSGTLIGTNGRIRTACENIDIFGTDVDCTYDFTGVMFSIGAQHLTANEAPINFEEGEFLCPEESFLSGLLETTANRYVLA